MERKNNVWFSHKISQNEWVMIIATRQGGFVVPYVWEIVVRKDFTILEGCHFPWFYIIDLIEFSENRDKEFQFGPMFFQSF